MTLLAGIFTLAFTRLLGRWRGGLLALVGISLYTLLVGAQAAVVRAAVMGGLAVFAAQLGRRQNGLTSLAFTSAVMAFVNPQLLWDIGFQLSVAATLGLVMFGESWPNNFYTFSRRWLSEPAARKIKGPVGEYFLLTLAAQMMTLPVIIYHFRRLSLVSLLANPIILPIQPAVMIVGGLSLLAGLIWIPAGSILAVGGWVLVAGTIRIVEILAAIPGAEIILPPIPFVWVAVFYALILVIPLIASKTIHLADRFRPGMIFGVLCVLVVQIWRFGWSAPDGLLHFVVMEMNTANSSGEGLLIRSPDGGTVLINGGPSMTRLSDSLGRRLVGASSHLDVLVVAGVEEGQLQSLSDVLPRYMPHQVVWCGDPMANRVSRRVYVLLQDPAINFQRAKTGIALDLGEDVELRFLTINRRRCVLTLEHRQFMFLLPLGMDFENLEVLMELPELHGVTGLLLAGSGYDPLNPPEWLAYLEPEIVLLSVAAQDSNGLPDTSLLDAIQNPNLLRTDRNGWIELIE